MKIVKNTEEKLKKLIKERPNDDDFNLSLNDEEDKLSEVEEVSKHLS